MHLEAESKLLDTSSPFGSLGHVPDSMDWDFMLQASQ